MGSGKDNINDNKPAEPSSRPGRGPRKFNAAEIAKAIREHARRVFNSRRSVAVNHKTEELSSVELTIRYVEHAIKTFIDQRFPDGQDTQGESIDIETIVTTVTHDILIDSGYYDGVSDEQIIGVSIDFPVEARDTADGPRDITDDDTDIMRRGPDGRLIIADDDDDENDQHADGVVDFTNPPMPESEADRIRKRGQREQEFQNYGQRGLMPADISQATPGEINSLIVGFALGGYQEQARALMQRFADITSVDEQVLEHLGSPATQTERQTRNKRRQAAR